MNKQPIVKYTDEDHQLMFLYALYKDDIKNSPYFCVPPNFDMDKYLDKVVHAYHYDPIFRNIFMVARSLFDTKWKDDWADKCKDVHENCLKMCQTIEDAHKNASKSNLHFP